MQAGYDWSVFRRQPGSAVLVVLHKVLVQLIRTLWPLLLVMIFNTRKDDSWRTETIALVFSLLVFLYSLLEYWFFRFSIPAGELVVKKGVFVKRTIVLPLNRIQAVHIDQNWLHRLLNLSQVSFDSPGSKNAEVKFAMHREGAEALRNFILGEGIAPSTGTSAEKLISPPFYTMQPYDLLKMGLSANHLEAFFILLAFGVSVLDDIESSLGKEYEGTLKWLSDQASSNAVSSAILFGVVVLVISIIASFVLIVLRYANFRISRTERGFQVQSGLINMKEKLVPFRKIQYISWKANWIRKQLGFYLLQFHSIGTMETRRKWEIKVPVTNVEFLPKLLQHYHHALPADGPSIKIHPAYIGRRFLFRGVIPALVVTGFAYLNFGPDGFWALLWIPLVLLTSWLFQKKFRLLLHPGVIQVHRAIFGKEEILLTWNRVQSVKIIQGIYQRQKGLATVLLYTAGGVIRIPFISLDHANQLQNYALFKVESEVAEGR